MGKRAARTRWIKGGWATWQNWFDVVGDDRGWAEYFAITLLHSAWRGAK